MFHHHSCCCGDACRFCLPTQFNAIAVLGTNQTEIRTGSTVPHMLRCGHWRQTGNTNNQDILFVTGMVFSEDGLDRDGAVTLLNQNLPQNWVASNFAPSGPFPVGCLEPDVSGDPGTSREATVVPILVYRELLGSPTSPPGEFPFAMATAEDANQVDCCPAGFGSPLAGEITHRVHVNSGAAYQTFLDTGVAQSSINYTFQGGLFYLRETISGPISTVPCGYTLAEFIADFPGLEDCSYRLPGFAAARGSSRAAITAPSHGVQPVRDPAVIQAVNADVARRSKGCCD